MKLQDYIRGRRKGKGARQIELDSMADPFLGEALEGYDAVEGDHGAALDRLSARLAERARSGSPGLSVPSAPPRRKPIWSRPGLWASVASLAIVFGISVVFYRNFMTDKPQMAYDFQPVMEEEIVVSRIPANLTEDSIPEPSVPITVPDVINIVSSDTRITNEISFSEFSGELVILPPMEKMEFLEEDEFIVQAAIAEAPEQVALQEEQSSPDEIVVIGYGTQKKQQVSRSTAIVAEERRSRSRRGKEADQAKQAEATDFIATAPATASPFGLNEQGESYRKIQGLIKQAKKPAPEDVNTGEMVNYFYYAYEKPAGNEAVNINYEIGECPWNPANKLVIITAATQEGSGRNNVRNLDLKVSFNPVNVSSYRLVGMEDTAGDGGHESLLALYEIVPAEGSDTVGNIMNLDLSYKEQGNRKTKSVRKDVKLTGIPPSDNFWFASAVAMFGEILKGSIDTGDAGYDIVIENANKGLTPENAGARSEFIRLVESARELSR